MLVTEVRARRILAGRPGMYNEICNVTAAGEGNVETNDREKLMNTMAENQKFFDEHGYWNVPFVERKSGYPKQEACDDPECYHRFPEHIIFRDMQCDSAPDEALRKSCVWSKI